MIIVRIACHQTTYELSDLRPSRAALRDEVEMVGSFNIQHG